MELYKSYIELTATIGFTILFLFLHFILYNTSLQSDSLTIFVDLSLAPWLIWITKKIFDTVRAYRLRMGECDIKYDGRIKELEDRLAFLTVQKDNQDNEAVESGGPSASNQMDISGMSDEDHSLIMQARNARMARMRAQ